MSYYKVVAGSILIHKANLLFFLLEALGEYYNIQDQTAG